MLEEGVKAPDFSLKDSEGKIHRLSDYRGKKVIVYFYPKDNTPGCTTEACNFRDDHVKIMEKNAVILGVSGDSVDSHKKFQEKYSLPFTLLSDPGKGVIKKYGALKGKKTIRSTFIIDENGKIIKVFPKVTASEHSKEVLEIL